MTAAAKHPWQTVDVPLVIDAHATDNKVAVATLVLTVTTAVAHGLKVGHYVKLENCTDATMDGTYIVVSVPTTTTFTVATSHADVGEAADTAMTIVCGVPVKLGPNFDYDLAPIGIQTDGALTVDDSDDYMLVVPAVDGLPSYSADMTSQGRKVVAWTALGGNVRPRGFTIPIDTTAYTVFMIAVGHTARVQIVARPGV